MWLVTSQRGSLWLFCNPLWASLISCGYEYGPFLTCAAVISWVSSVFGPEQIAGGIAANNVSRLRMSSPRWSKQTVGPACAAGLDARMLAALAMSRRAGLASQALASQGSNTSTVRRSVDLGSLAHTGNFPGPSQPVSASMLGGRVGDGARSLGLDASQQPLLSQLQSDGAPSAFASPFKQSASQLERGQYGLDQAASMEQVALNAAILQSQRSGFQPSDAGGGGFPRMDSQGSEQLLRFAELAAQQSGQLNGLCGQPSGQLGASYGQLSSHNSLQLGHQPLPGQSSQQLPGSFLSQGSGQLGAFGQLTTQPSGHLDMSARQHPPRYSPGGHSLSSAGSIACMSDQHFQLGPSMGNAPSAWLPDPERQHMPNEQQQLGNGRGQMGGSSAAPHKLQEDFGRIFDEQFVTSGGSTPSQGPDTPSESPGSITHNGFLNLQSRVLVCAPSSLCHVLTFGMPLPLLMRLDAATQASSCCPTSHCPPIKTMHRPPAPCTRAPLPPTVPMMSATGSCRKASSYMLCLDLLDRAGTACDSPVAGILALMWRCVGAAGARQRAWCTPARHPFRRMGPPGEWSARRRSTRAPALA
jgi:hypothetical protein